MNYDLDFRYRRALQPDGLRTIITATGALNDAIADCRRAGVQSETCPAVILLARHLGRIAQAVDPELTHGEDLELRSQCYARIADLKSKPALIALVRGRRQLDAAEKAAFHAETKRALRAIATSAGLGPQDYDLRSNIAGPAVSGEVILHTDQLYVMVSATLVAPGREVLYRRCQGRQDYLGERNTYCDIALLANPAKFLAAVRRETGVRFAAGSAQLI